MRLAHLLAGLALLSAGPAFAQQVEPAGGGQAAAARPYAATGLPDRIVLTPGASAATEMAVAFRTDARQQAAAAEIAVAIEGPTPERSARAVTGRSFDMTAENGPARYHQIRFTGLQPDTGYVYRVRGAAGWSEWLQFRTATAEARPFTFLYFGDTQNDILSIASRTIRQAFRSTASPALALHAGDLVSLRADIPHDDEWGQWAEAGGYNYAIVPQLPAPGNHEYVDHIGADGQETRRLSPHWPVSFALPANGAPGVERTTYFVDYQGVRFIVLDGTAAIDLGGLDAQTRWLDETLVASPARWNIVLFHQPIFTCARPRNTEALNPAWLRVLEARRVDLVLQGHDHCYARITSEAGRESATRARAAGDAQGPVYIVSVTGSKMYGLNDRADAQPDRVAEMTQLYQRIDIDGDRLAYRAFTATGRLYDGFDLSKGSDGRNRLTEAAGLPNAVRRCEDGQGPDGGACTARPR